MPERTSGPLDERSRAVLDFERDWWRRPEAKERAIRERLGLSPTRYYQLLNRLIDEPDALAYDPMLVKRLRRLRVARRRQRFERNVGR
ncbi:MAG TPA: DUF3263 domain-containing protein [Actinomycetota bacterium]|nr:DUF3263 domain-containing protein [Actinomycetota bacterium]